MIQTWYLSNDFQMFVAAIPCAVRRGAAWGARRHRPNWTLVAQRVFRRRAGHPLQMTCMLCNQTHRMLCNRMHLMKSAGAFKRQSGL